MSAFFIFLFVVLVATRACGNGGRCATSKAELQAMGGRLDWRIILSGSFEYRIRTEAKLVKIDYRDFLAHAFKARVEFTITIALKAGC